MVNIILSLPLGTFREVLLGAKEILFSKKHIHFIAFFPAESPDRDLGSPVHGSAPAQTSVYAALTFLPLMISVT